MALNLGPPVLAYLVTTIVQVIMVAAEPTEQVVQALNTVSSYAPSLSPLVRAPLKFLFLFLVSLLK